MGFKWNNLRGKVGSENVVFLSLIMDLVHFTEIIINMLNFWYTALLGPNMLLFYFSVDVLLISSVTASMGVDEHVEDI